jgi:hypothetical protein
VPAHGKHLKLETLIRGLCRVFVLMHTANTCTRQRTRLNELPTLLSEPLLPYPRRHLLSPHPPPPSPPLSLSPGAPAGRPHLQPLPAGRPPPQHLPGRPTPASTSAASPPAAPPCSSLPAGPPPLGTSPAAPPAAHARPAPAAR